MKNRVAALIGEKQARENRMISAADVARETGLTRQVISKWINNEIVSYRADMVDRLCRYFKVQAGDLIYVDPDPREAEPN